MTFDEAWTLLDDLPSREVRSFMRSQLAPADVDRFDVFTEHVSNEVLLLASVRALVRLREIQRMQTGRRSATVGADKSLGLSSAVLKCRPACSRSSGEVKVPNATMCALAITPRRFQGEWNYKVKPRAHA
jgi:hypothetical protein